MANRYWVGGSGNWSDDDNHWASSSGGSPADGNLPTSSDDVHIDTNSGFGLGGTITLDTNYQCNNFICSSGHTFTVLGENRLEIFGSTILEAGLTLDIYALCFSSNTSETITTNGATIDTDVLFGYDESSQNGFWTLQDDFTITGTFQFNEGTGTFDANDHNVTANDFYFYADTDYTPTIIMGSGTWEVTGTGYGFLIDQYSSEIVAINAETSTIKFSSSTVDVCIIGCYMDEEYASKTLNNIWFVESNNFKLEGNFTFNELKLINVSANLTFIENTTTIVATFNVSGLDGDNLVIINSNNGVDQFTLSKSSGVVSCDYLDISNSNVTGGAIWNAGENSIDNGNNNGWIFSSSVLSIEYIGGAPSGMSVYTGGAS